MVGWPKKIRARSPAAYAARRPSCGPWVCAFAREGHSGTRSSGCMRRQTASAPSAASATMGHHLGPQPRTADDVCNCRPEFVGPCRSDRSPSQPLTMLTVLTQKPPLVLVIVDDARRQSHRPPTPRADFALAAWLPAVL